MFLFIEEGVIVDEMIINMLFFWIYGFVGESVNIEIFEEVEMILDEEKN